MSEISLKNINKSYGNRTVIDDISFKVSQGEMVSLLGPSGCGKTTLLKIIAGLIEPDSGDIILNNDIINNIPVEKRGTVIVFQDPLLFPHMNAEQNIGFGLRMAKSDKKYVSSQVQKMLELVQLEGFNHKYPHQMSGGEKQRIALARALAVNPKVLLLDEPFSSLDEALRNNVRELTLSIQKRLGITCILVTHDHQEAMMLSDRVLLMMDSRIIQQATPEEIYKNPVSVQAADFFGEKNYIKGSVKGGVFSSGLFEFKADSADIDHALAMIKPSDVIIARYKEDINAKVTDSDVSDTFISKTNKKESNEKQILNKDILDQKQIHNRNENLQSFFGASPYENISTFTSSIPAVITESRFAGDKTYYTLLTNTKPEYTLKAVSDKNFALSETVNIDFKYENIVIFKSSAR